MKDEKAKFVLQDIDAIIFDMDGVITETAGIHAEAWKQLFDEYLKSRTAEQYIPFKIDPDYYRYIDGKPRYEGVKSFLESRNIILPYGIPDDPEDNETVCGLGNRKNRYFLQLLEKRGVKPFPSSVRLVKDLKRKGIPRAVISASRNCKAVLKAAGVEHLFDTIVDGIYSASLNLKGKPAPDIFLEAARNLGVKPQNSAIVEDSLAGVEAGKAGNFKLVIGVNRAEQAEELRQRGADIVVSDLSELKILVANSPTNVLSSALDKKDEIFQVLRKGIPAIFLDYDGTLTPIVRDPEKAIMPDTVKKVLQSLTRHWFVAIISGRDLKDVQNMVGIENIYYAGSHGFETAGPGGYHNEKEGEPFLPALERAEKELMQLPEKIKGLRIERKRFAIAIHYRNIEDITLVPEIERQVDQVAEHIRGLRKTTGKKIFELRPDVDWDKGRALLSMIASVHLDTAKSIPLYIGDDVTDEDAFHAIRDQGIGIIVGKDISRTSAQYTLADTLAVEEFLRSLATLADKEASRGVWTLTYHGFNPNTEGLREALCTLGNGYFATRGASPESRADGVHYPGTYIGGCYNRLHSDISGQSIANESLVNLPNWLPLDFRIEGGDWFDVNKAVLLEYRQELDLLRGVLSRFIRFSDKDGRRTRVSQRRFVHMAYNHLAGQEMTIVAENWSGKIDIRTALDGRVENSGVERYSRLNGKHLVAVGSGTVDGETVHLEVKTTQSQMMVAEAMRTRLFNNGRIIATKRNIIEEPGYIGQEFTISIQRDEPVSIEKIVSINTCRDRAISESAEEAKKEATRAADFPELLGRHILAWDHLWDRCRITIDTDRQRTAQILHLHIFHLLQTVSTHSIDLDVGVPPRGLHGEAYRGHIMWDELFILPFLNLRIPDITRGLLMYRYRRLKEARWAAKQAGYRGAMFPWQSGSDGREESQALHLNPMSGRWLPDISNLQRHINIAIAYNIWHYYQVTGDINFIAFYGAEVIVEITRFLASLTTYNKSTDRYEIRHVMGPDEFHDAYPDASDGGINNNAYTNVMAVWVMCRALEVIDLLPESRRKALSEDLSLQREELEHWDQISHKMFVPFHDDGIISQFEHYNDLKEFNWEAYRKKYGNIQRLDRILEAESDTPNRYKLSKQADVLMLFYLLSADELREIFNRLGYSFERETIPRNIEYYLKRTSHGSTLSRIVHSWVLARSQREQSWHFFQDALESDISDIQGGTTSEGIHLGAMAGTIDLVQRCYTGIEVRGDILRLNPSIPRELRRLEFHIEYRQHWLHLQIEPSKIKISSYPGDAAPVKVGFGEEICILAPGDTLQFDFR